MRLTTNSILSFTPDPTGWTCEFTAHPTGETWTELVIGWAASVTWNDWQKDSPQGLEDPTGDQHETEVAAILLSEGMPIHLRWYLADRDGHVSWALVPPPNLKALVTDEATS